MTDYGIPGLDNFNPGQYLQQNVLNPMGQALQNYGNQYWKLLTDYAPAMGIVGNALKATQGQNVTPEAWVGSVLNTLPFGAGKAAAATGVTKPGLKALAETRALARRSPQEGLAFGAWQPSEAKSLYGPGTYFAPSTKNLRDTWGPQYGDNVYKIGLSPKAALDIARGGGYADVGKITDQAYNSVAQRMYDPLVEGLQRDGVIGVNGPSLKTSWLGGKPGVSAKPIGKLDPETGAWVNPKNPAQATSNFVRQLAAKKVTNTDWLPAAGKDYYAGELLNPTLPKMHGTGDLAKLAAKRTAQQVAQAAKDAAKKIKGKPTYLEEEKARLKRAAEYSGI